MDNKTLQLLRSLWSEQETYFLIRFLLTKENERYDFEQMSAGQIEFLIEMLQNIYVEQFMEKENERDN